MPVREGAPIFAGDDAGWRRSLQAVSPQASARRSPWVMSQAPISPSALQLEAEVRGKRVPLTVAALPFIPHHYHRKGASK